MKMKVRDFLLKCEQDIDVYTDVIERNPIAYCPVTLMTEDGIEEWSDVLKLTIDVDYTYCEAVVECETEEQDERAWQFFASVAGYCSDKNWNKWFETGDCRFVRIRKNRKEIIEHLKMNNYNVFPMDDGVMVLEDYLYDVRMIVTEHGGA